MDTLQKQIEERLAQSEPGVEVLLVELVSSSTVRVFIDHPEGVTLGLCERVSEVLSDVREQYALEVSSPGVERPLTKPDHFQRFVGRRARVRTRPAHEHGAAQGRTRRREGRGSSFTGELVGASESEITLAANGEVIAIPYAEIRRSNLLEE